MKKAAVSKGANKKKVAVMTHVIEANAAGIDVGSTESRLGPKLQRSTIDCAAQRDAASRSATVA